MRGFQCILEVESPSNTIEVSLVLLKPEKILAIPLEIVSNYYLVGAPFGFYPTPKLGRVNVGIELPGFRFRG